MKETSAIVEAPKEEALKQRRDDEKDEDLLSLKLQRRFPWMHFASNLLFLLASVLYLVLGIDDYRWAKTLQDLPMWLRTADDDSLWVNYRLEERYNASLEAEADMQQSGGGGRMRLLRLLQFEQYQTNMDIQPQQKEEQEEQQAGAQVQTQQEEPSRSPTIIPLATPTSATLTLNESLTGGSIFGLNSSIFTEPTPEQLYYNDWWVDLPPGIREAYSILGFNETIWNSEGYVPADEVYWDDLPPQQRQAALFIGYDQDMWDESVTLYLSRNHTMAPTFQNMTFLVVETDSENLSNNVSLPASQAPVAGAPPVTTTAAPTFTPTAQPTPTPVQTTPAPVQPTTTAAAPVGTPVAATMVPTATVTTPTPPTGPTPAELYYDEYWADLPPEIQEAYTVLGYTETIWDTGGAVEVDDYFWDEMSPEQQEAAAFIGYTKEAWDSDDDAAAAAATTAAPTLVQTVADSIVEDSSSTTTITTTTITTNTTTQEEETAGQLPVEPQDNAVNPETVEVEAGYYDEYGWEELPPHVQEAAEVLGYDQSLWDNGGAAETDDYWWKDLSSEQQAAAAVLGYDEASWNGEDTAPTDSTTTTTTTTNNNNENENEEGIESETVEAGYYEDYGWDELPPHVQEAAGVLGYDQKLWDTGGVAETDNYWWDELSPEQQAAAAVLGYDLYSWDAGDTIGTADDYVSYDDDYIFEVKATGTWVSRYMILYFSAAMCFVIVGVLDLIREKHAFHILMIIAGAAGVLSAMLVEKDIHISNIFNSISVHFFMLEAFTLFGSHKRAAITTEDSDSKFMVNTLAFGDLLFGIGALLDVILSYFYLFDDTIDWDTNMSIVLIGAAVMWLICSLIYLVVFFYEYNNTKDVDFTNEKELHSSDEEDVVVIAAETTDGSENRREMDRTEQSTRYSPDNSTDELVRNEDSAATSPWQGELNRQLSEISV